MTSNKKEVGVQVMAFASQLLPAIIGILSFMLLVRTVEAEALGQYIMYLAAVGLFEMVKSGGLQSALVMRLSGKNKEQQLGVVGSAYWFSGIVSVAISIVLGVLYFSNVFSTQPAINVFCGWYACLGILTLPLHIAEATAVARQDLKFLLYLRLAQSSNSLIIAGYSALHGGVLQDFATIHLVFTIVLMCAVIFTGKTNPIHICYKLKQEVKDLVNLIKYTIATLATTTLLKNGDTFLIGALMGPKAVAAYAVPLKLTELFEIPLRSLYTTAFPQLAAANNENNPFEFRKKFVQYFSWAYILYIPALCVSFIMAPYLVLTLGGEQYIETASVFRVFCIYGLFLPADRMTALSLDAMQLPNKNLIKVMCMATVNLVADYIAISVTHSLDGVAFASVLNALTGALIGFWMLQKTGTLVPNKIGVECVTYFTTFTKKGLQRFFAKPV